MASQTKEWAGKLDLVGGVVALVLGLLLVLEKLSLEIVVGVLLIVVGILAIARTV